MMICAREEMDLIDKVDGNYDRYIAALSKIEHEGSMKASIDRANKKGYYSKPENRISGYVSDIEKLVGRTMTLEDIDGYSFEDVVIKDVVPVEDGIVVINGKYRVNLKENQLTNGGAYVTLGSMDTDLKNRNTTELGRLTGTVLEDLDSLIEGVERLDGKRVDSRLGKVFGMFKNVLSETGTDVDIDVTLLKDLDGKTTAGYATPENGKMTLINGNSRYNTQADILAHELQHVMVHNVLSTNAMLKAQVLKLRDAIASEVDYKAFLPVGSKFHTSEDVEFAKARYEYVFLNPNAEVAADEFLVAATTNIGLMNTLDVVTDFKEMTLVDKVKTEPGQRGWRRFWNRLVDKINKLYRTVKTGKQSGRELALEMLDTALTLQHAEKNRKAEGLYEKAIEKIMQADRKIAEFTSRQRKGQKSYAENIKEADGDKISKAMTALWNVRGLAKMQAAIVQNNIFSSITRDLTQPDVAKFYQMFRHAKAFVENAVAPMKQATIDVLYDTYELGKLDKGVRQAAKRVIIDTDAKALGSSKDIKKFLEDESLIDAELNKFAQEFSPEIVEAVQDLGMLLVHNETSSGNVFVNAAQIGHEFLGMQVGKEVDMINRAASLVALKESSTENKALALKALNEKPVGMDHAMRLLTKNEEELLQKAYSNDTMYLVKGSKQEAYAGDKKYYIVDEKEAKQLKRSKMSVLGKHEALSRALEKDVYLVVGDNIDVAYTEGLLSKVQLRNEGESLKGLLMEMNEMSEEEAADRIDELIANPVDGAGALIPERSGLGAVYDLRMRIPHSTKAKYLGVEDDIIRTVSESVSNLSHKQEAMVNNKASIQYFKRFHKKYANSKDFKFVEISKDATGKFKAYWDELPYYLKKDIDKQMDGKLMIEQSFLTDFFGYKDVSIVNSRFLKGSKKRQAIARKVEKMVQEVARTWKHHIVAKTAGTIFGNTSSNMVVALQHTKNKNPMNYLKDFQSMWSHINTFQKLKKEAAKIDVRRKAGEKIDEVRYKNLHASMKNNPIYPIMQDGQYSQIMEDIDKDWFDQTGIIEEKLDKLLDKTTRKNGKLSIKDIVNTIYVRKGSVAHDSVMKMTSYADAINKVIIYNALKEEGEMSEQEMLNYVDQLHVNYGYLDNRWVKYANDTLVLSFTKYFFRVFPAMMKVLHKRALSVFLTESVQELGGFDAETPFDPFYNPFDSMMRKFSGWSKPFDIFGLILSPVGAK